MFAEGGDNRHDEIKGADWRRLSICLCAEEVDSTKGYWRALSCGRVGSERCSVAVSREGVDGGGQGFGGGVSIRGILRQAAHDEMVKGRRQRRIVMRRRRRRAGNDLRADGADRIAIEGPNAGRHLVKNDTQREKVGTGVLQITENLFRGEIGRSSHQIAAARDLRGKVGNAEVTELYLTFGGHENIGGFHVAMNDLGAMGSAECGRQDRPPTPRREEGQGTGVKNGFQRFPLNIFHNQIRCAVFVRADIVESNDVGMREAADDLGFAEKLLLEIAGTKTLKKGFQSDGAPNKRVAGFIDTAGGARAKRFDNFVSILRSVHKPLVTRNVRRDCFEQDGRNRGVWEPPKSPILEKL